MTRFGGLLYTYENNHSILYLVMVQFSSLMILPALFDLCKSLKQDIKRVKMTSMSRFLLPIAKMFIAIRSGAWKREKYTSLDVVFSLVQIKVGMSKSQVRRCVIIVYLLSFFITSGASKNWPKRSPILTKINWTKFRVRLSRVAQNVPTFFLRKTLRCPLKCISRKLFASFNQNSDDGQRRCQLPFPMRCYFLFPIPHWHTIVFFLFAKIKKENLLRPAVQSWRLQE